MNAERQKRTKVLTQIAAELVQFPYEYTRVGFDTRWMEFANDGRIEVGSALREAFWRGVVSDGIEQIEILGLDGELTCRLRRFPDDVWRGRWEDNEMMPIELRRAARLFQKGPTARERIANTLDKFSRTTENLISVEIGTHAAQLRGVKGHIVEEDLGAIPLAELLRKHGINKLDLLRFEAAGSVLEILKQLDSLYPHPELLLFEHKHLPAQECCFRYLRNNGYDLMHDHDAGNTLAARSQRKARAVLIQHGTGEYVELLRLSHPVHSAYAERHGLAFWSVEGDVQNERSPHWNKIVLLRLALDAGFELVIWLDADALIVRPDEDIRDAAPKTASIGMCQHPGEWQGNPMHFNSGVVVARNTPQARLFLEKVWSAGPVRHGWQEQVRILECAAEMPDIVSVIDNRWNSCEAQNPCDDPVIKAWHGCGTRTLELMRGELLSFAKES